MPSPAAHLSRTSEHAAPSKEWFRRRRWHIGSGMVEATNRTQLTERMKGAGMCWSIDGGQTVPISRSPWKSSRRDVAPGRLAAAFGPAHRPTGTGGSATTPMRHSKIKDVTKRNPNPKERKRFAEDEESGKPIFVNRFCHLPTQVPAVAQGAGNNCKFPGVRPTWVHADK